MLALFAQRPVPPVISVEQQLKHRRRDGARGGQRQQVGEWWARGSKWVATCVATSDGCCPVAWLLQVPHQHGKRIAAAVQTLSMSVVTWQLIR